MRALSEAVAELLEARAQGPAAAWLRDAAASDSDAALKLALARAPRKVGRESLDASADECARHALPSWLAAGPWRTVDLVRAALVEAALRRGRPAQLVATLIRTGELGEQQSLLRALGLLPEPARFVETAVDACRTNAVPVFEAIALDNAYAAAHFETAAFNQMVIKAVFLGVPVARIVGLEQRANPQLRRMAQDYASERRAAGRPVPADVELILSVCPPA